VANLLSSNRRVGPRTKVLEGAPSFVRLLHKGWALTIQRHKLSALDSFPCSKSEPPTRPPAQKINRVILRSACSPSAKREGERDEGSAFAFSSQAPLPGAHSLCLFCAKVGALSWLMTTASLRPEQKSLRVPHPLCVFCTKGGLLRSNATNSPLFRLYFISPSPLSLRGHSSDCRLQTTDSSLPLRSVPP
jgi:hypothetical protein